MIVFFKEKPSKTCKPSSSKTEKSPKDHASKPIGKIQNMRRSIDKTKKSDGGTSGSSKARASNDSKHISKSACKRKIDTSSKKEPTSLKNPKEPLPSSASANQAHQKNTATTEKCATEKEFTNFMWPRCLETPRPNEKSTAYGRALCYTLLVYAIVGVRALSDGLFYL